MLGEGDQEVAYTCEMVELIVRLSTLSTYDGCTACIQICCRDVGYRVEKIASNGAPLRDTVLPATCNDHFEGLQGDDDVGG